MSDEQAEPSERRHRTREEHLGWCKARALEYVDAGDLVNAFASMMSDLDKHPGTASTPGGALVQLSFGLLMTGNLSTNHEMRRWIKGFN